MTINIDYLINYCTIVHLSNYLTLNHIPLITPPFMMSSTQFYEQLTPTERRVLSHCMADGSCKSIAEALGVSTETVRSHRKSILRKLGVCGKENFRRALRRLELAGGLPPAHKSPQNHPKFTPWGDVLRLAVP